MNEAKAENIKKAEILKNVREKIDHSYWEREDYPSYSLTPWNDRAEYHWFVIKLIDEEIAKLTGKSDKEEKADIKNAMKDSVFVKDLGKISEDFKAIE